MLKRPAFERLLAISLSGVLLVLIGSRLSFPKITFPERYYLSGGFERMEEENGFFNGVPVKLVTGFYRGKPEKALKVLLGHGYMGKGNGYAMMVKGDIRKILEGRNFNILSGIAFQVKENYSQVFLLKLEGATLNTIGELLSSSPPPPSLPHCAGGYGFDVRAGKSRLFISIHDGSKAELLAGVEGQDFLKDYIKVDPYHYVSGDRRCTFSIVPAGVRYACVTSCT